MAESDWATTTHKRDWEIRRRVKGDEEWHTFAIFDSETWWREVQESLEYFRSTQHANARPEVEYAAFEIMTRKIELKRRW